MKESMTNESVGQKSGDWIVPLPDASGTVAEHVKIWESRLRIL